MSLPQLPSQTKVLIVGAGPSGLTSAVSLIKHGIPAQDIVVVDNVLAGENTSRAIVLHAATVEALESVGCADELISMGIHMEGMHIRDRQGSQLLFNDFSSLCPYTKYPYALTISQTYTEKVLRQQLESLSVHVLRPLKAVGMKASASGNGLDVTFESGEVITAQYVIGADGARSVIRQMSGIGFADPEGLDKSISVDPRTSQMVLADISFTENIDHIFSTDPFVGSFGISPDGLFLTAPLGHPKVHSEIYDSPDPIYRIGFSIPLQAGEAPSRPGLEILQKYVDQQGPLAISSDPSQNPNPMRIKKVYWSTRFRTHSAIADTFFKRVRGDNEKENGGIVMLVGDGAHIHSPVGGQGMNLGIRDAVGLGSIVAKHIQTSADVDSNLEILQEFAEDRHGRALKQIAMTKRFVWFVATMMNPFSISYWMLYLLAKVPFVRRNLVWQLSGLGNR